MTLKNPNIRHPPTVLPTPTHGTAEVMTLSFFFGRQYRGSTAFFRTILPRQYPVGVTPSNAKYCFCVRKALFSYHPIPFFVNEIVNYLIDFILFFFASFCIRQLFLRTTRFAQQPDRIGQKLLIYERSKMKKKFVCEKKMPSSTRWI